jgi:hypothetical protein
MLHTHFVVWYCCDIHPCLDKLWSNNCTQDVSTIRYCKVDTFVCTGSKASVLMKIFFIILDWQLYQGWFFPKCPCSSCHCNCTEPDLDWISDQQLNAHMTTYKFLILAAGFFWQPTQLVHWTILLWSSKQQSLRRKLQVVLSCQSG